MVAAASSNRGWLLLAALIWTAFCIYGSLVPLNYRPLAWDVALQRFEDIRYLQLGMGSRADWVANILLFIPLGFLWIGVLWPRSGLLKRLVIALLVFAAAVLLSLSIEFTQLYFPPRTVSQNDIIAETIGAAIGIGLWWWLGPGLMRWLGEWRGERTATGIADRSLWVYLFLLFGYNLLPLDLTISPVEIYHKWQLGRVSLIPFAYPVGNVTERIYGLLTDIVIWIPVGMLLVISRRRAPLPAWGWAVGMVLLLELGQLLVWSRVSDVTDLISGAIGSGIGVLVAMYWKGLEPRQQVAGFTAGTWVWTLLLMLGWIAMLAAVFWYPYDFQLDWRFLQGRLAALERSPLHIYYYGTEFRAVTEVLHKFGFFLPLGVILAWPRATIKGRIPRRLLDISAILLLPSVAMMIELGQVALPTKYPDISDWTFESLGALAGYFGVIIIRRHIRTNSG